MSYMILLEVLSLPNDIVDIIYECMKVNAANVIGNYFRMARARHRAFLYFVSFGIEEIHFSSTGIATIDGAPEHLIKDIYTNLMTLYRSHYSYRSTIVGRNSWQYVLNKISKMLMFYYNRLALNNLLKKKTMNYKYLRASIELWFTLCQKYHFYLMLHYLKSTKKMDSNRKAIQVKNIKTFMDFRISPIVNFRERGANEFMDVRGENWWYNYKLTRF
jgi:hypothetical protein